jgi:hypothetical protein
MKPRKRFADRNKKRPGRKTGLFCYLALLGLTAVIARSASDEAIQLLFSMWIASQSLSSGAHFARPVGSQ